MGPPVGNPWPLGPSGSLFLQPREQLPRVYPNGGASLGAHPVASRAVLILKLTSESQGTGSEGSKDVGDGPFLGEVDQDADDLECVEHGASRLGTL